ncbi:MAG: type II toxin-antitoxin system HicA family toxin [Candidatus Peregrinibacteria bacterium]
MSKLRRFSGKTLLRLFRKHGWLLVRVQGSHHILRSPDGRIAVVPLHGNATLHTGLLNNLLRKHLQLSREEIERM